MQQSTLVFRSLCQIFLYYFSLKLLQTLLMWKDHHRDPDCCPVFLTLFISLPRQQPWTRRGLRAVIFHFCSLPSFGGWRWIRSGVRFTVCHGESGCWQITASDEIYSEKWERKDTALHCLQPTVFNVLSDKRLWKRHQRGISSDLLLPIEAFTKTRFFVHFSTCQNTCIRRLLKLPLRRDCAGRMGLKHCLADTMSCGRGAAGG